MPQPLVLVVDDNSVVTRLIDLTLGAAGYHVQSASSGPEALLQLGTVLPDLILLDVEMPGLGGLAVLQAIRAERRLRCVPVVMLTASSEAADISQSHRLGASGYLLKPFNPDSLLARVERVLRSRATVWVDDYHTVVRAMAG